MKEFPSQPEISTGCGEVVSLASRRNISNSGRAEGANTPAPSLVEELEENNRLLSRDLAAERARFQTHLEAWRENSRASSARIAELEAQHDSAIGTLQDIAALGKKAGSELARHRLHELGVETPDYGSMT